MCTNNQPPAVEADALEAAQQFLVEFEACFSMENVASAGGFLGQLADRFPALLEAKEVAAEAIRRQQEGGAE